MPSMATPAPLFFRRAGWWKSSREGEFCKSLPNHFFYCAPWRDPHLTVSMHCHCVIRITVMHFFGTRGRMCAGVRQK
jgi:hypothetical protein